MDSAQNDPWSASNHCETWKDGCLASKSDQTQCFAVKTNMIPAFVIHHSPCADRQDLVDNLVGHSGATVLDAVWFDDPEKRKEGCSKSHVKVATTASQLHPDLPYLVFEDDCILANDWKTVLEGKEDFDVVYLGVNSNGGTPFGTHAMLIRPAARQAILEDTERLFDAVWDTWAFDHIVDLICKQRELRVWVPPEEEWHRWALQKKGMISTITGVARR